MTQRTLLFKPLERSRPAPGSPSDAGAANALSRRQIPWLLLAVAVAFAPTTVWGQYYGNTNIYHNNHRTTYRRPAWNQHPQSQQHVQHQVQHPSQQQNQRYAQRPDYASQSGSGHYQQPHPHSNHRPGRVLMIRGAFTVFSLGLDTLATKLRAQGLDVVVSTAATSGYNANALRDEYRRNPNVGPVVIIGHSRGGLLAPDIARSLGQQGVPVDLVVIVDNTHENLKIPANVKRAINFYQTDAVTLLEGQVAFGEGPPGQVANIEINKLPGRDQAGFIDHFNIEESDWVHGLVMEQVLQTCPRLGETPTATLPQYAGRPLPPPEPVASAPTYRPAANPRVAIRTETFQGLPVSKQPVAVEPDQLELGWTERTRTQTARTPTARTEPARPEPSRIEPGRFVASPLVPVQTEPLRPVDPRQPVRTVDPTPLRQPTRTATAPVRSATPPQSAVRSAPAASLPSRSNQKKLEPMFDYFDGVEAEDYWKK
ncbi:thioesterase domain-containing protein [Lignipirellula cremea]|uniref:Thioesterase domain protein n=1 Tax=Lignipirellula cremea TaxID=2528010 RepID=A0A518E3N5_9BACT|nr:thioesterase domain-containing protein [Lignipirellula cremea]QDU98653.1 Thioesterase domain protein [Lignipirellula cremea]